jgi:hypothetical protein
MDANDKQLSSQDFAAQQASLLNAEEKLHVRSVLHAGGLDPERSEKYFNITATNYRMLKILGFFGSSPPSKDLFEIPNQDTVVLYGDCNISKAILAHKEALKLDMYHLINHANEERSDSPPYVNHSSSNNVIVTGMAVLKLLMESAHIKATDEALGDILKCSHTSNLL